MDSKYIATQHTNANSAIFSSYFMARTSYISM